MAKFNWSAGTSADWSTISDWTPTTGAPPGVLTVNQDQAVFHNTHKGSPTTYTVSVATAEAFDLATVSLRYRQALAMRSPLSRSMAVC